jgi:hypothetical protein
MENKVIADNWYAQAGEEDKKLFREWVTSLLHNAASVKIHFRKKDDSIRIMECTLMPNLLPVYEKKTERVKAVNEEVCSTFDLEKAEWRSFRFDTITKIEFDL